MQRRTSGRSYTTSARATLVCTSTLLNQLCIRLICTSVNEHIYFYVHYFVGAIWHYSSNSTHIWHFLPTGSGEHQRFGNASEQTAPWCKECPQLPAQKERPQVPPLNKNVPNDYIDVLETTASGSHLRQGDVKRKGADLLVAPLKLNVRLSKCGPRSVEPLRGS